MNTKSFSQFLEDAATAIQAKAGRAVDLTVGSIMRAWAEAVAQTSLVLQSLIVYVASITRLSTSQNEDVDSFVGDFGITRLPAVAASGSATFSRTTPTNVAPIPVGTQGQTGDGTQTFSVIADSSNPNYDAANDQYLIPAGTTGISVPVQAAVAGAAGNISANTLTVLLSPLPGVDSITNTAAFTNGADAESDDALKKRFAELVAGATQATKVAIEAAIDSLQQGLTYSIVENQTKAGATQLGYFYVVVDDGTGSPPQSTLDAVYAAIDGAVRGFTITFAVFAPTVETADVSMSVSVSAGADATITKAAVQTAVQNYINGLALGATLPYSQLYSVAYGASPDVTNVTNLLLNGGTSDLTATASQVIRYGTVTIN